MKSRTTLSALTALALTSASALTLAGLPVQAATLPTVTQLVAHGPNGVQKAGTTLTYSATAQGHGGQVEYQYWEEFPSGWAVVQNYLKPPQQTAMTLFRHK